MAETRLYRTWLNMRQRCNNFKHPAYKDYGGRGITVCERWNSFANFVADMGERPEGMTLERKNNDGNYEPSNCRWATKQEQRRNRRSENIRVNNKSGVVGVSWHKSTNKWRAYICINYKIMHLGRYSTKEEAIRARKLAEIKY